MEMKVLLVDSDQQLCAELVVMLHMFQCFRVVENVQTAEEAIAYVQSNEVDVHACLIKIWYNEIG